MVRTASWRARASAGLLLAAVSLTACGEQGDAEPVASATSSSPDEKRSRDPKSTEPVPANAPDCSAIWADGTRIPRGYQGCAAGGAYVKRDSIACSSGQRMVRYADRYYGVIGGTVHEAAEPLLHDRDFRAAVRSCRA
jgi:hypothetical protein